jgi:hypothetical protein
MKGLILCFFVGLVLNTNAQISNAVEEVLGDVNGELVLKHSTSNELDPITNNEEKHSKLFLTYKDNNKAASLAGGFFYVSTADELGLLLEDLKNALFEAEQEVDKSWVLENITEYKSAILVHIVGNDITISRVVSHGSHAHENKITMSLGDTEKLIKLLKENKKLLK